MYKADQTGKEDDTLISIIILAAVAAADLIIKNHIERRYTYEDKKSILGDMIVIQRSSNEGAFLGIFKKYKKALKIIVGLLFVILLGAYVTALVMKKATGRKTGLALILAGAASNEYDRIKKGSVTDYFSINLPFIKHIVFNLGDFSIFAGIITLLLSDA